MSCLNNSIKAENNVCTKKYPYMKRNKNGISCCYQTNDKNNSIKAYPDVVKEAELGENLNILARKIIQSQRIGDMPGLEAYRNLIGNKELVNLIVFDVQTTGVPVIISDENNKESVSFPAIIQFSFYHPKTGRHFTSYVTPHKPITFETAYQTGIYNSFEPTFKLPFFSDKCTPREFEDVNFINYTNNTLLEHPDVKEFAESIRSNLDPKLNSISEDDISRLSIEKFLEERGSDVLKLKSLDQDEEPMFYELIDEIFEFLSIGESTTNQTKTILLSHNGSRWAEPIFRAELERVCASDLLDENIIFLDSKDLFRSIVGKLTFEPTRIGMVERILGDGRSESFNTMADVLSLWSSIEDVFRQLLNRKDWNFIVSKIIEEIYLMQRMLKN